MSFAVNTVEERFALLRSVGEECIQENELHNLVEKKPDIRCYDGFEPSGRMHIAQGVFKAINVNKCTAAGCTFVFWVADWFALMNDKVGGELEKINAVGRYLIEVWKAAGMDMEKVVFLWSSEEITAHADVYWKMVLDIGRRNTLARIKKCCTIMGKAEGTLTGAQILYPLMQCSDIFFLRADICQLGLDQRKVNMLAREYCDLIGRKLKPVILSHHMLAGLKKGQSKMSKSDPDSAIFMEDTAEEVARKIRQAYCPRVAQVASGVTEDGAPASSDDKNPVLDYYECILFSAPGSSVTLGGQTYRTYEALETAFVSGTISEEALKEELIERINGLLRPVQEHFAHDPEAHRLLELVKSYRKSTAPLASPPDGSTNSSATKSADSATAPPATSPHACLWLPPAIRLPLDTAVTIVEAVSHFLSAHAEGCVTIVLPDWSAMACNEVTGEEKNITAALQYSSKLLSAYQLPSGVRLVKESDLILADSNRFWVTAINVGRANTLARIEALYGGELQNAGQVVAALMRVAGAVMLKATHAISLSADSKLNDLIAEYTKGGVSCIDASAAHIPPLHRPDAVPAHVSADDVLFLDDTDMDLRRKIKRAYCAPNERHNSVVAIAQFLLSSSGELNVVRQAGQGETSAPAEAKYTSVEELGADCAAGAIHPGDLKAAVTQLLLANTSGVRAAMAEPEMKKLAQTLRNAEKKMSKRS